MSLLLKPTGSLQVENSGVRDIVWQIVASIPKGKVATYGQIAKLAGYPGYARYVGTLLSQLPEHTTLPWHRVVNARGEISLPMQSESYNTQLSRLESEGIEVSGSRVKLKRYGWKL